MNGRLEQSSAFGTKKRGHMLNQLFFRRITRAM